MQPTLFLKPGMREQYSELPCMQNLGGKYYLLLDYFPSLTEGKTGLWDHCAVCYCVCFNF
jgi:hypothetical protein